MRIIQLDASFWEPAAPLLADFRVALQGYKGIQAKPDLPAAREELLAFLQAGYPVFAAEKNGAYMGYMVCRIEDNVLWVEHLYVRPDARRQGVASGLFARAEEIARGMGEDTVFNYVHPNNDGMIAFLRAKGYTVLNLIEIRKPYSNERMTTTIQVGGHRFDY